MVVGVCGMVSHGVEQNLAGGKILIKGNALGTDL